MPLTENSKLSRQRFIEAIPPGFRKNVLFCFLKQNTPLVEEVILQQLEKLWEVHKQRWGPFSQHGTGYLFSLLRSISFPHTGNYNLPKLQCLKSICPHLTLACSYCRKDKAAIYHLRPSRCAGDLAWIWHKAIKLLWSNWVSVTSYISSELISPH